MRRWVLELMIGALFGCWLPAQAAATEARRSPRDLDGDGVPNRVDNCVVVPNPGQADADRDGLGDLCECGDVNADGRLSSVDAGLIQRCTRETPAFTCGQLPGICDADDDGRCTDADASLVQKAVAGLVSSADLGCRAKNVTLGVLGDSLADEYNARIHRFDFPLVALNWVEQLVKSRHLNFGTFNSDPQAWGEPRKDGFSHNWSRYGLSVMDPTFATIAPFRFIQSLAQLTSFSDLVDGLVADVEQGSVDIVFVHQGHNDLFIHLWCGGATPTQPCLPDDEVPGGLFRGPEFEAFRDALVTQLFAAVDRIRAAGPVAIVIAEIIDILPPLSLFHEPLSIEVGPDVYARAVGTINAAIEREAKLRGIPFARVFDPVRARLEKPGFPFPAPVEQCLDLFPLEENDCHLRVGGRSLPVATVAEPGGLVASFAKQPHGPCWVRQSTLCAGEDYALSLILQDEVHPNTVVQGLMANGFLEALNRDFDLGIPLLTDAEILDNALSPYEPPKVTD